MTVTSRRPNVATSPRGDAPTSRRRVNNAEVNKWKRRDISTSRRLNMATLQRRDVSSRSVPYHLKYEWLRNQGIGRRTNESRGIPEQSDTDYEEVNGICTLSHFLDIF